MLDDDTFHNVLTIAESGLVGAALAAPSCCKHSRATLRRPGPLPVGTLSFLDGVPSNRSIYNWQYRNLPSFTIAPDCCYQRVTARMPSSMTWLAPLMEQLIHCIAPYAAHASACLFGADWVKTWCFMANKPRIARVALSCDHPPGCHESVVGVRPPDGTFKSRLTAEYPEPLANGLASIISSFTTQDGRVQMLADWQRLLPVSLTWPVYPYRVEELPLYYANVFL